MRDPHSTSDGQSYEGAAIKEWFKQSTMSPLTGAQLQNKILTRNHALRNAIEEFNRAPSKSVPTGSSTPGGAR